MSGAPGDGRPEAERVSDPADVRWGARLASWGVDREALVVDGRSLSYAGLARAVDETAEALDAHGLRAGDLVAVLAPPSAAGVALFHALLDRRIVLLPLNARLREPEQAEALARLRPTALIVGAGVDTGLAARLAEAGACSLIGFEADGPADPVPVFILRRPLDPSSPDASARLVRRADRARVGAALVLLTSGTSGRSKGVVLTRANLWASAEASMRVLPQARGDRWLLCLPLFHVGGLSILVRSVLGGTAVLLHERFDAEHVARELERGGVTQVSLVATMLARLLEVRGEASSPPSLRVVLLGGGPASAALLARAHAAGYPLAPTYGLTEAASQVATRAPTDPSPEDGDLAGGLRPLPGVELRVVDAQGRPVPVGEEGEIRVRGAIVMQGYLDEPEATAAALDGGWLATGDVGRLDRSGGLRVLDRRSDLIVSGGENVYPAEIESVLQAHPAVAEAGVVGRADEAFGARPVAFVVAREGVPIDLDALARFARERLAGYKAPVAYHVVEALPRTASGKLQRGLLVERLRAIDGAGDASGSGGSDDSGTC
ncbi:MAG TPA: o-succinylbenzoate--CoA ligase [Myxococcota bacterium]|nr:o-succinylbenzoate--CoA ligase [Myxococcota bacterium]